MKSEETRLGVGIVVSLLVNALVIVPGLTADLQMGRDASPAEDAVRPPTFEPDPEDEPEVKLGIENSEASTLTWIGYEQYQEHMARLAELEQARFDMGGGDTGGGGSPAPPTSQPTKPQTPTNPEPQPRDEPQPEEDTAPHQARPETQPLPDVPDDALPKSSDTNSDGEAEEPVEQPKASPTRPAKPNEQQPQAQPSPSEKPVPEQTPSGDQAPTTGPPAPTPGTSQPGADDLPPVDQPSKRQSHATTKTQVNVKKWGGPVAAEGLTVNTRNLSLTAFEEMQFRNVVYMTVLLDFGADGKVARVWIERVNPKTKKPFWEPGKLASGYESKVVTSLFGWRAEGEKLKALEDEKTISIPFNLVYR